MRCPFVGRQHSQPESCSQELRGPNVIFRLGQSKDSKRGSEADVASTVLSASQSLVKLPCRRLPVHRAVPERIPYAGL